jgi:Mg2+-importing ATPase
MEEKADQNRASFWQQELSGLFKELGSHPAGLSQTEASQRLSTYGPNVTGGVKKRGLIPQFLSKFKNPLVIVLLVSSVVLAFTGDLTSFIIIAAIILVSVTIDFVQERQADQAAERLRQSVVLKARVIRDGQTVEIPTTELVPGDIVSLSAGDLIPGDGRVLEANDFFVNQALLSGEPYPIEKFNCELPGQTEVLSCANAVLMGTSVISGSAKALVIRTGRHTMFGEIADTLVAKPPPTAFDRGTRDFGLLIMRITILLVLFVLLVNALFHRPWLESFLFAVALAVGLTPELLPMVVTVTLARGAQQMAKKHVIVKRLASIENFGSMDVLCTDKTGTLTEARIHLERHIDASGKDSSRVLELAYLNSYFETGLKSPLDDAILEHKEIDPSAWRKIDEVPFDFERRRVSVLLDNGNKRLLVVKGAPEDILKLSTSFETENGAKVLPLDEAAMFSIRKLFEDLGRAGLRVLGIAWRQTDPEFSHAAVTDETKLVFAGFAARQKKAPKAPLSVSKPRW